MGLSVFFVVCTLIFSVIGLVYYIKQIFADENRISFVSWIVWLIADVVNILTYFTMVKKDCWEITLAVTFGVSSFVIVICTLLRNRIVKIKLSDVCILGAIIAVICIRQSTNNDQLANLLLQAVFASGFVLTVRDVLKGEAEERLHFWVYESFAGCFSIAHILLSNFSASDLNDWLTLVFPVSTAILGNSAVIVATMVARRRKMQG